MVNHEYHNISSLYRLQISIASELQNFENLVFLLMLLQIIITPDKNEDPIFCHSLKENFRSQPTYSSNVTIIVEKISNTHYPTVKLIPLFLIKGHLKLSLSLPLQTAILRPLSLA